MALLLQGPSAERRLAGLAVAANLLRAQRGGPVPGDDDGLLVEIHAALAPSRFLERLLSGGLRARGGGAGAEKGLQCLAAAVAAALCSEPTLARQMAESLAPALMRVLSEACEDASGAICGTAAPDPSPGPRSSAVDGESMRLVLDVLDALLGIAEASCSSASAPVRHVGVAGALLRAVPRVQELQLWPAALTAVRALYCLSCSEAWGVSSPALTPSEAASGFSALGACLAAEGNSEPDTVLQLQLETVRLLGSPFSSLLPRCLLDRSWSRGQHREWEGRFRRGITKVLSNRIDGSLSLAALRAVGAMVELQGMRWVLASADRPPSGAAAEPQLFPVLISVLKVEVALLLSEVLNPRPYGEEPRGSAGAAEPLLRDLQTCFGLVESCIQALCELDGSDSDGSDSDNFQPHFSNVEPHTLLLSIHEIVSTVIDFLFSDESEGDAQGRMTVAPGALRLAACYLSQNPTAFPSEGQRLVRKFCGREVGVVDSVPFFLPLIFQVMGEPEWQSVLHDEAFLSGLTRHTQGMAAAPLKHLGDISMLLEVLGGLFSKEQQTTLETRLAIDSELGRAFLALCQAALGASDYSSAFHDPEDTLRSLSIFAELLAIWLIEDCTAESTAALASLAARAVFLAISLFDRSPALQGFVFVDILDRLGVGLEAVVAIGERDPLLRVRMEAASVLPETPGDPGGMGKGFQERCDWASRRMDKARKGLLGELRSLGL